MTVDQFFRGYLPEGKAKTIAGVAVAIEAAFLMGMRCGRMVEEDQ